MGILEEFDREGIHIRNRDPGGRREQRIWWLVLGLARNRSPSGGGHHRFLPKRLVLVSCRDSRGAAAIAPRPASLKDFLRVRAIGVADLRRGSSRPEADLPPLDARR